MKFMKIWLLWFNFFFFFSSLSNCEFLRASNRHSVASSISGNCDKFQEIYSYVMHNIHEKCLSRKRARLGPQKHKIRVCREKVFQPPTVPVGEILKSALKTVYFLKYRRKLFSCDWIGKFAYGNSSCMKFCRSVISETKLSNFGIF